MASLDSLRLTFYDGLIALRDAWISALQSVDAPSSFNEIMLQKMLIDALADITLIIDEVF